MELDPYSVLSRKEQPFVSNMDITRGINDAQAYYIFDRATIDRFPGVSVDDFLKQNLTMNTVVQRNGETSDIQPLGNTSSINLRGLGTDKTLVLVNGRRLPRVTLGTNQFQGDLNGIPLTMIERIEVLPSSASGIYGGSAMGGAVNVILKKNYTGGEVKVTYDNTWDTDSPRSTFSLNVGFVMPDKKTRVTIGGSWSESKSLLLQDRRAIFQSNLAGILARSPGYLYSSNTNPFLGALPNITATSGSATSLTLKNGVILNSRNTHIAAGTSSATTLDALYTSLAKNAGTWNLSLPDTTQTPTGLRRPFGVTPQNRALYLGVRREITPMVELFFDGAYLVNRGESVYSPLTDPLTIPSTAPSSPFASDINISIPINFEVPQLSQSESRSATLGVIARLPADWVGEADVMFAENRHMHDRKSVDLASMRAEINSGVLNPFVDTLQFPLDRVKYYLTPYITNSVSRLSGVSIRASGPLAYTRWSEPTLTLGIEQRKADTPENRVVIESPLVPTNNAIISYFRREQDTSSAYCELSIPLLKGINRPMLRGLTVQLAGRTERYTVDGGTPNKIIFANGTVVYSRPRLANGQPVFSEDSYSSTNGTIGIKYEPVRDIIVRASVATAFLPPTPEQLLKNPEPDSFTSTITDRITGTTYAVATISGGNPTLVPQGSKSWNAGLIFQPKARGLNGMRLNLEYYRIVQENVISTLSPQQVADNFPDRATRGAGGVISLLDVSALNLFKQETIGWDFSVDFTLKIRSGSVNFRTVQSLIENQRIQYSNLLPEYDAAGTPADGGAARHKGTFSLAWSAGRWSAAWAAQFVGSYKQSGAPGTPVDTRLRDAYAAQVEQLLQAGITPPPFVPFTQLTDAQGSNTIPSQIYHDLSIGYSVGVNETERRWGSVASGLLSGMSVQIGVRNVLNAKPPLDVFYRSSNYYLSPYGDMRMRTYWVSLKKDF